jgi:hypothetical protein
VSHDESQPESFDSKLSDVIAHLRGLRDGVSGGKIPPSAAAAIMPTIQMHAAHFMGEAQAAAALSLARANGLSRAIGEISSEVVALSDAITAKMGSP